MPTTTCVIGTQVLFRVLKTFVKGEHNMTIKGIQRVTDLTENERAFPENGIVYGLRAITNSDVITAVGFVVRRGDRLIARGCNGEDFPVSGKGAFVMTPRPIPAIR